MADQWSDLLLDRFIGSITTRPDHADQFAASPIQRAPSLFSTSQSGAGFGSSGLGLGEGSEVPPHAESYAPS